MFSVQRTLASLFTQNLGDTGGPFLVTLNPPEEPRDIVNVWRTSHPIPSPGAAKAAKEFGSIQGKRGVWFCGAYQGYGFHEDGLKVNLAFLNDIVITLPILFLFSLFESLFKNNIHIECLDCQIIGICQY